VLATVFVACGKSSTASQPVIGGLVGLDQAVAAAANGPYPAASSVFSCGTTDHEFAAELATVDPTKAQVQREWGDVVTDRQWYAAGTVAGSTLFNGDFPFTHPFGNDFTLNIKLDSPFRQLAQRVGAGAADPDVGSASSSLHWEIERRLIPHQSTGDTDFLDGFLPLDGDRIATYGRWIVDCGHNDFHTEIHPPTFVAFGHANGGTTVAHAWYTPYRFLQLLTPSPFLAADVTNTDRLKDPTTQTLPRFLVAELLRIVKGEDPQIVTHQMLGANTTSPVDWWVCAPGPKPDGATLKIQSAITVRPGVSVVGRVFEDIGCVHYTMTIGSDYRPMAPVQKSCEIAWDSINQQAQAALGTTDLDIKQLIASKVPASSAAAVERDPMLDCYDPLVVPAPGEPGKARSIATNASQPYPMYGEFKVSWSTVG
jgi:hypothetical protein